jgi:hypothetical protein
LIRRIDESGLVPSEDLDLLAQAFLAAGTDLYSQASPDWFDGPEIIIQHADAGTGKSAEGVRCWGKRTAGGCGSRGPATFAPLGG